jgi:hypothetical protein
MTIAAGSVCTDGLVLASDTLFTGVNKHFGKTLWFFRRDDAVLAFGGSGSEDALLRMKDEIGSRVDPTATETAILRGSDKILQYVIETERAGGVQDKPEVFLGVRSGRTTRLYFSVNGDVFARLPEEAPSRCIGWATGLGQYIADSLCPVEGLSMQWAEAIAAHLIKQAKTYSGYCDGDTEILEIPNVGEPRIISAAMKSQP